MVSTTTASSSSSSTLPTGFSFTAPRISEEMMKREQELIPQDEKAQLRREMYGKQQQQQEKKTNDRRRTNNGASATTTITTASDGDANSNSIGNGEYHDDGEQHQDDDAGGGGIHEESNTCDDDETQSQSTDDTVNNTNHDSRTTTTTKIDEHVMQGLQEELNRLVASDRDDTVSYERALEACPDYVQSDEFREPFLHTTKLDFMKAAVRIITYWKFKLQLFPDEEVAFRRPSGTIRLDDLSANDVASLDHHGIQLLPKPDRAGRRILFCTKQNWRYQHRNDIGRLLWYLFHVALKNDGNGALADHGLVLFLYDDGPFNVRDHYDRKLDKLVFDLIVTALPVRVLSVHHCIDSVVAELLLPVVWFMMGSDWRRRYHFYKGKSMSAKAQRWEKWKEFGIGPSQLPRTRVSGGTLDWDVEQWKAEQRRKEEEEE